MACSQTASSYALFFSYILVVFSCTVLKCGTHFCHLNEFHRMSRDKHVIGLVACCPSNLLAFKSQNGIKNVFIDSSKLVILGWESSVMSNLMWEGALTGVEIAWAVEVFARTEKTRMPFHMRLLITPCNKQPRCTRFESIILCLHMKEWNFSVASC